MKSNSKKQLPPQQRDELLATLKTRFEKNMARHIGIKWPDVQAKLESNTEKLWSMLLALIRTPASIFFMIALQKALKAAEAFVMIMKHWKQERNISLQTARSIWLRIWALKY